MTSMKFGLFGGARSQGGGPAGDSLGYRAWIDYVHAAERLGFHSVFAVEHHFTGRGPACQRTRSNGRHRET